MEVSLSRSDSKSGDAPMSSSSPPTTLLSRTTRTTSSIVNLIHLTHTMSYILCNLISRFSTAHVLSTKSSSNTSNSKCDMFVVAYHCSSLSASVISSLAYDSITNDIMRMKMMNTATTRFEACLRRSHSNYTMTNQHRKRIWNGIVRISPQEGILYKILTATSIGQLLTSKFLFIYIYIYVYHFYLELE